MFMLPVIGHPWNLVAAGDFAVCSAFVWLVPPQYADAVRSEVYIFALMFRWVFPPAAVAALIMAFGAQGPEIFPASEPLNRVLDLSPLLIAGSGALLFARYRWRHRQARMHR